MKIKITHIFYVTFFVTCFIVFVVINQQSDEVLFQWSDAVLVELITLFSSFILYYDFNEKLSFFSILPVIGTLIIINSILAFVVAISTVVFLSAYTIPLFMIEGAVAYWFLERRASLHDE